MALFKSLYERSTGDCRSFDYDMVFDRFRCNSYEVPDIIESRLFSCSFAEKPKNGHILASTCENGEVIISNTKLMRLGSPNYCQTSKAHDNAVFSLAWNEVDMKMVTTSGDNSARLWNVHDDGKMELLDTFLCHRKSVKTACFQPESSNVFATGSYDGNIFVWDTRSINRTPDQHILKCHQNETIASLTFQDEVKVISCSINDTNIKVWDLRKTYVKTRKKSEPLYQIPSPKKSSGKGYNHLIINKNSTKLYARCFDHVIYCFNILNYSPLPESSYYGYWVAGPYGKLSLSPDERYIASTGVDNDDSNVFVWRTNFPEEPLVKFGAMQLKGLSSVSWCPEDELMLATSSDDPVPCIWSIPSIDCTEQFDRDKRILSQERSLSQSSEVNDIPLNYVERLHVKGVVHKRISAMVKSLEHVQKPISELSPLPALPNGYQIHICIPTKKCKKFHPLMYNKKVNNLPIQRLQRKPAIRRKSSVLPQSNDLYQYFKRRRVTIT